MSQPPIAPDDVRSLFRSHWEGAPPAMAVLTAPPVLAAFRREVRWGPHADRLRRADPDLDEHLHAGVVATLEYAVRGQGLAVPPTFWSRRDAGPFVALVFRHRLVDRYRRDSRLPVSHNHKKLEWYAAPPPPASAVGPTPRSRLLEYRRRLDDGSLRIGHALAFGAAHDLGLVQEVLDRLEAGTGPDPALLRPARETAQLLQEWLERVPTVPAPCRSRRMLAWIMRAADREGPSAWQARDPAETTKAMDLLLKWQHRAEATLPARLLRELGPAVVWGWGCSSRGRSAAGRDFLNSLAEPLASARPTRGAGARALRRAPGEGREDVRGEGRKLPDGVVHIGARVEVEQLAGLDDGVDKRRDSGV
jgi:hypothetical protein